MAKYDDLILETQDNIYVFIEIKMYTNKWKLHCIGKSFKNVLNYLCNVKS